MRKFMFGLISLTFFTLITGCASSSPSRFYTLSPASGPAVKTGVDYAVSVGPVVVPAMVDRPQIVLRAGPNRVFIDEFDRWASPLRDNIQQVVVENLISMLGTTRVTVFPKSTAVDASYRTLIKVLRFDSELGKEASLDALWEVKAQKQERSRRGRTTLSEPVSDDGYEALVAAHSRALAKLSAEIADAIRAFETGTP